MTRDGLHQTDAVSFEDTLRLFRRTWAYIAPFRSRFVVKMILTILALLPTIFLGIPIKVLVDHVIRGTPLVDLFESDVLDPFLNLFAGLSRSQVLVWMVGIQAVLIYLIGAFGTGGGQRDQANGNLVAGQDDATRSENEANRGGSFSGGLFGLVDYRYHMRLNQDLNHHYRSLFFRRLQSLPMTLFDDERIGDAVYRVMYDTPAITNLATRMLLTPVVAPLNLLLATALLYLLFPNQTELAGIAFTFLPLAFLVTLPFTGRLRRAGMQSRGAGAETTTTMEEGMSNILAVQSLGASSREQGRFDRDSWRAFGRFRALVLINILVVATASACSVGLASWAFVFVTDEVVAGRLTPGDFTLIFTIFFQVLFSAFAIGRIWVDMQGSVAGLNRVFFLMDLPSEQDHPGVCKLARIANGITYHDVDFDYPDGTAALRGINLEVPVGRVTAFCGPAGAGKSTLAYLIPRFVSPTHGSVRADGIDLDRVTLESLRGQISFVFQENALFDMTVEENIRMANPAASEVEVRRAAQIAGADEFISRLPQGYKTRLGRAGGKLSVGQKQRLSIARALVRDCRVLVLDEPTSALDPETEQRLVVALREASRDRAVVVIAHRLSTIRTADTIVFLEAGRIRERGTHAELMARGGEYARFVALQTRGAA